MNEVVVDASAVLALLRHERGHDRVEAVLDRATISAVNLAEVLLVLTRKGASIADAHDALDRLRLTVAPFDAAQAWRVGGTTGPSTLSLGDRACLALAASRRAPALTADRAWTKLNLDVEVELLR